MQKEGDTSVAPTKCIASGYDLRVRIGLFAIAIVMFATCVTGEPAPTTQAANFRKTITKTIDMDYLVMLPASYGKEAKSPLLIFLHGSGAVGHNVGALNGIGPIVYAKAHAEDFPFVIV